MWKYLPKPINNCLKRVDKTEDAYSEIDRTVKNFSCEKVILVFHSPVLKQPDECKIFCKICNGFYEPNQSAGLWKTTFVNFQLDRVTIFESLNRWRPSTESFRTNGSLWCGAFHQTPCQFPDSSGSSIACKGT